MVSKRDEKLVLWPLYFDKNTPRPWRRVALDVASDKPTAEEVAKAAQALRLRPVIEKGVAHPSRWYERAGRVLVDIRGSKSVLLRQIAEKMIEKPAASAQPAAKKAK